MLNLRFHKHLDVESRVGEALVSPALPLVLPKSTGYYHQLLSLAKTKVKAPSLTVGERTDMYLFVSPANALVCGILNEYMAKEFFLHP
jgi:hypothetical protein